MLTLVIWERPSAAAAGTAAAASSAAGTRLRRRGSGIHSAARKKPTSHAPRAASGRIQHGGRAGSRERVTREGGAVKGEWGGGSASSCRAWQDLITARSVRGGPGDEREDTAPRAEGACRLD